MNIFGQVIKRYVATILITVVLVLLGLFSVNQLPVSFYPDFEAPVCFITTPFPGAGPTSVESEITKLIEDAISAIPGIEEINSTSQEGFSLVRVSFDYGESLDNQIDEVQQRLDKLRPDLPREAGIPEITTVNDFLAPPIELAAVSERYNLGELKQLVENSISPELARLPGVAAVAVTGGVEEIVKVDVKPLRLRETGLGLGTLIQIIQAANTDFPIGSVEGDRNSFILRLEGKYQTIDAIKNLPVPLTRGQFVPLWTLADVSLVNKDQQAWYRVNGREAVGIVVRKPSGGNSVTVSDEVKRWLRENGDKVPDGIELKIVSDESEFISGAINEVFVSLLLGAILASIVIFLFLGNIRNTLVIILSIPVSVIVSFLLMRLFNLSINTVSLGGMGMAVGLVVDSAIIVLENIFRYLEEQYDPAKRLERIASSTKEVALSITASILTTVVVFLPLAFTSGLAKVLLGELSLVIVFALSVSIVVSLTLIPVLSFFLIRTKSKITWISRVFIRGFEALRDWYIRVLGIALKRRWLVLVLFIGLFVVGIGIASSLETGLFPEADQGQYRITLTFPRGTNAGFTNERVVLVEEWLNDLEGVRLVASLVGEDSLFNTLQPYIATINVYTDGNVDSRDLIVKTRNWLRDIPGLNYTVTVVDASAGFQQNDIDLIISGNDLDTLRALGDELRDTLKAEPGFTDLASNLEKGLPSIVFVPNRVKMSQLGISVFEVAQLLRTAKSGSGAGFYTQEDFDIKIEVALADATDYDLNKLKNIPVTTRSGQLVPVKSLGTFVESEAPSEINRIDQRRSVSVTGSFQAGINTNQLKGQLNAVIDSFENRLPEGYLLNEKGASRAIAESFQTLGYALLIAVLLVYVVMAIQFNSFKLPFVLALSIPLAFPGALILLFLTGTPLNLPSFLGFILLSGIIVNDGILLLDFVKTYRDEYDTLDEAIIAAARIRFRPIVMTTLTTVFGMLFLALNISGGAGALRPLAIAVIGGLLYGLWDSAIFVPVLYTFFERKQRKADRMEKV
jgi:HAE1 family hydrophobic/amphiphilic exporter-1